MAVPSETIIADLITQLQTITTANGYTTNVATVKRYRRGEEVIDRPAIIVRRESDTNNDGEQVDTRVKTLSLQLQCKLEVLPGGTEPEDIREVELGHDIELAILGITYGTKPYNRPSMTITPGISLDEEEPEAGVTVDLSYDYQVDYKTLQFSGM